jgi:DNA processing protein
MTIQKINPESFPLLLREIPDSPPYLYIRGELPSDEYRYLCVVGARAYTSYGKSVVEKLISELKGQPIVIVSGLALGIDSIAHKAALSAGLKTIAVPGSGLDPRVLYPRTNILLAEKIIESGGALLSEFDPLAPAATWSFPKRNRIMAGLSHAVLIIEAEQKSGTLITARLATDYNRDVFAIPGSLFSKNSEGPHRLLKLGAKVITTSADILEGLDLKIPEQKPPDYSDCTKEESLIISHLSSPTSRERLLELTTFSIQELNMYLSMLELKNHITDEIGIIKLTA